MTCMTKSNASCGEAPSGPLKTPATWAKEKYGPVAACFTGAAIFFVVTLIAAGSYMLRKRQIKQRAQTAAKSAAQTMLADPMVVAAGLQLIRTIGIKKLIPLLAVGGLALGLMANRSHATDQAPAE